MTIKNEALKATALVLTEQEKAKAIIVAEAVRIQQEKKPIMTTMINTTALLFTGFGGTLLYQAHYAWAMILVAFGFTLEFIKYEGMKRRLW